MMREEERRAAGARARAIREEQRLSQEALAKASKLDQSSISDFERGHTKDPAYDFVMRLAAALRTPLEFVMHGRESAFDAQTLEFAHAFQKLGTTQRAKWMLAVLEQSPPKPPRTGGKGAEVITMRRKRGPA